MEIGIEIPMFWKGFKYQAKIYRSFTRTQCFEQFCIIRCKHLFLFCENNYPFQFLEYVISIVKSSILFPVPILAKKPADFNLRSLLSIYNIFPCFRALLSVYFLWKLDRDKRSEIVVVSKLLERIWYFPLTQSRYHPLV